MADGIYSMYGDFAPISDLIALSHKYPQLNFYFDDVHGMSWIGSNGTGYVLNELDELSENILLFGMYEGTVISSIFYFIDNEIHHRGQGFVYLRSLGIEPPAFYER